MGNWLGSDDLSDEEQLPGCAPPDQVVVTLQYSHKLGDVTECKLESLLDTLSKTNLGPKYQWTLSAPIQSSSSVPTLASTAHANDGDAKTTTSECASASVCDVAMTNQFCMTRHQPHNSACWPYGVNGPTDSILVDLWMSSPSVTEVLCIDKHVKTAVSGWVKTCLKFNGKIWLV
jgi:hypothetical protein